MNSITRSIKDLSFIFNEDDVKVINKILRVPYDMFDPGIYGSKPVCFINHCAGHALWGGIIELKHKDVILNIIGGPLTVEDANGEKTSLRRKVAVATYVAYATVEWCYSLDKKRKGIVPDIGPLVQALNDSMTLIGGNDIVEGLGTDIYYMGKSYGWYQKEMPFHINPSFVPMQQLQAPKPRLYNQYRIGIRSKVSSGLYFTLRDVEVINQILTEPYHRKLPWDLWTLKDTTKYLLGVTSLNTLEVCDGKPFLSYPLGVAEVNNRNEVHTIALKVYVAYLGAMLWHRPNYLSSYRHGVLMSEIVRLECKTKSFMNLGVSGHMMHMGIPGPKLTIDLHINPLSMKRHNALIKSAHDKMESYLSSVLENVDPATPGEWSKAVWEFAKNSLYLDSAPMWLTYTEHESLK